MRNKLVSIHDVQVELGLGVMLVKVHVVAEKSVRRVAMPVDDDGAVVDG